MLTLDGITVRVGGASVLRSLTLSVPAGATVGLVGRNGAGKTTTLKAIMGLLSVVAGQIRLEGQDVSSLPPHHRARRGIAYMPEDRRLIGPLSVEDNVLLPLWAQRRPESASGLAAIYGFLPELESLATRPASQLSGGQQKLVALARTLVGAPRLLLLDEPMEGVSPTLSARLAEAIQRVQDLVPGLSVLVAESDLKRMRLLTTDVRTIERGEIVNGG